MAQNKSARPVVFNLFTTTSPLEICPPLQAPFASMNRIHSQILKKKKNVFGEQGSLVTNEQ